MPMLDGDGIRGLRESAGEAFPTCRLRRDDRAAGGRAPSTAPLAADGARTGEQADHAPGVPVPEAPSPAEVAERRREFTALLEAFRDTAVLVPLRDDGWLTADFGGVRWILAFSDESALARYAVARGEGHQEWTYRTVLGHRLLDV